MYLKSRILLATLTGMILVACAGSGPGDVVPQPTSEDSSPVNPTPEAPAPESFPEGPPGPDDPLAGQEGPPLIRLVVDGEPVRGVQGSYCWTDPGAGVGLCVDMIPPDFDEHLSLPVGQPIQLQLDEPVPDSVTLTLSAGVFEEPQHTVTLPGEESLEWAVQAEPGEYVLNVFARWDDRGDGAYFFSVLLAE